MAHAAALPAPESECLALVAFLQWVAAALVRRAGRRPPPACAWALGSCAARSTALALRLALQQHTLRCWQSLLALSRANCKLERALVGQSFFCSLVLRTEQTIAPCFDRAGCCGRSHLPCAGTAPGAGPARGTAVPAAPAAAAAPWAGPRGRLARSRLRRRVAGYSRGLCAAAGAHLRPAGLGLLGPVRALSCLLPLMPPPLPWLGPLCVIFPPSRTVLAAAQHASHGANSPSPGPALRSAVCSRPHCPARKTSSCTPSMPHACCMRGTLSAGLLCRCSRCKGTPSPSCGTVAADCLCNSLNSLRSWQFKGH